MSWTMDPIANQLVVLDLDRNLSVDKEVAPGGNRAWGQSSDDPIQVARSN